MSNVMMRVINDTLKRLISKCNESKSEPEKAIANIVGQLEMLEMMTAEVLKQQPETAQAEPSKPPRKKSITNNGGVKPLPGRDVTRVLAFAPEDGWSVEELLDQMIAKHVPLPADRALALRRLERTLGRDRSRTYAQLANGKWILRNRAKIVPLAQQAS